MYHYVNVSCLHCPSQDSLAAACEYMRKIRADMGGTNLLAPLNWMLRQPVQRGHPRLLFLLTDGAVSNTGKVIELVRSHARFTRYEVSIFICESLQHQTP